MLFAICTSGHMIDKDECAMDNVADFNISALLDCWLF